MHRIKLSTIKRYYVDVTINLDLIASFKVKKKYFFTHKKSREYDQNVNFRKKKKKKKTGKKNIDDKTMNKKSEKKKLRETLIDYLKK